MFRKPEDHENPAWPGLVDLFSFTAMLLMVLWVMSAEKTEHATAEVRELRTRNERLTSETARREEEIRNLKLRLEDPTRERIGIAATLHGSIAGLGDPRIRLDFAGDRPSFRITILDSEAHRPLTFETRSFLLNETDRVSVRDVARKIGEQMRPYPQAILTIEGTADPRPIRGEGLGPPRDNIELSALRSAEVARRLTEGAPELPPKRIHVVGLGERGQLLPGASDGYYRQYRRVELEIRITQGDAEEIQAP